MSRTTRLGPDMLHKLPQPVRTPAYDRAALRAGMAHIGVGAFHRSHQAEYTDDLLHEKFDRWGMVGINIREPRLSDTLGHQSDRYTRLIRENERVDARVIGSIIGVVDSQDGPEPALSVLSAPDIDVVTMTVTEKGYCHRPASGELDAERQEIAHDLANPDRPRSLPGLILRALEMRMASHGRPITLMSCDNIPTNGAILGNVVRTLAQRRGAKLTAWIEANVAFPSSMVDRIAPAVTQADIDFVERTYGYRDEAVVVGEPFRQWVIEDRFSGSKPGWDLVGATFVDDVTAYEYLKMRVLNGAQTTLSYLGVLSGHEYTFDDMRDPLLVRFVSRMLVEETLPTLQLVPGMPALPYVEQSLQRLRNTAVRHRNHQIATDGSQKIVQRLLNPIRERLRRQESVTLLSTSVAGWMAYLILASDRFGRRWKVDDPFASRVAAMANHVGHDPSRLVDGILGIEAIFDRELAASPVFRGAIVQALQGLLGNEPLAYVRSVTDGSGEARLNRSTQTA